MPNTIDLRDSVHPDHAETFDTDELRRHFLIDNLFPTNAISTTYLHDDRMMVMTCSPAQRPLVSTKNKQR